MKKNESHLEGQCRQWRSLLQLPAALDWNVQPLSSRCFSYQSWAWIRSCSLSCEFQAGECHLHSFFVNLCRLQRPLLKRRGQAGLHSERAIYLKKHPPLTLRHLPMKAHFKGKARPNEMIPCEWPVEPVDGWGAKPREDHSKSVWGGWLGEPACSRLLVAASANSLVLPGLCLSF